MTLRVILILWLALLGLAPLQAADTAAPIHLEGTIAGARWAALIPDNWNGRLLLEAPDRRHAPAPLVAELVAASLMDADTGAVGAALSPARFPAA